MGRDCDEVLAAIEQRIATVQAESASLEVARSVLVGVGVLAGARARDSQTASAGVSRSRKASLRRPMARPSRADASSALEPS